MYAKWGLGSVGDTQRICVVEEGSVYMVWNKHEPQDHVCTWEWCTSVWQFTPGLFSGALLPSHMDVSSNEEWDRDTEWESPYDEETGYKITWEKLS